MHVLKTQCIPILVYGCEIWRDKVVELTKVKVCLNKSVRRIFSMKQNEPVKYILMSVNVTCKFPSPAKETDVEC